ncbi:uncharacterized protein LOC118460676 [Anopheles albimanus]|uniref:uncharacterized protein LOC118460676 n=1 Tax=Anopheles albimanus TaxID=7167 RepID=UPI00164147CC|nr:uncharacterized protein LOC118460676 [Anopheles albimanus]
MAMITVLRWITWLLCFGAIAIASPQLLKDISSIVPASPLPKWNTLERYPMHYDATGGHVSGTALSLLHPEEAPLSRNITWAIVSIIKFIIQILRMFGTFAKSFGAELGVAKCLFTYALSLQPLSSKVASGPIINWLAGYFGEEDGREVFRFLARNILSPLGFPVDSG